ncbi:flagellar biosynthetic protein FliR [Clostridiaceae bacterium M8S5]|nr:flagellar biosynthetic protein FliR [Clostridiaceae bacterium M8S5]
MNSIINLILDNYIIFLVVLIRISGIFVISPVLSRTDIPMQAKVAFTVFISVLVVFFVRVDQQINVTLANMFYIVFKELLVGITIGFISYLFFISVYIAGQVIDMQIGFGMMNVFDPHSNSQVPITGSMYHIYALLVFLMIDGHHWLVKAIVHSYEVVPIGSFIINDEIMDLILRTFSQSFLIGFKISTPVVATIFLGNILLGIFAKTIPQMNVFVVGMPLKIVIGLGTMYLIIPVLFTVLQNIFADMQTIIYDMFKLVGKG